jgi:hypothetical protein
MNKNFYLKEEEGRGKGRGKGRRKRKRKKEKRKRKKEQRKEDGGWKMKRRGKRRDASTDAAEGATLSRRNEGKKEELRDTKERRRK